MAKPSNLPRWATDAGRTLEPTSGEKDTGWQAGYKPPARKMNWLFNLIYSWFAWLSDRMFDGAGANDFEVTGVDVAAGTDQEGGDLTLSGGSSTGDGGSEIFFEIAKANQGAGSTVRSPAQVGSFREDGVLEVEKIEATATIANGEAVTGVGNGTGAGIAGVGGSTNGPGVAGTGGSTNGIGLQGTGTGAGTGVKGTGGAANGDGVTGIGVGAGSGVKGTGGSSNGPGVEGVGGSANGDGLTGTGTGSGSGVVGTGGASNGDGVEGVGTGSGRGVYGSGSDGAGVHGYATNNYGVRAQGDPSSPAYAAMQIDPQDAEASTPTKGNIQVITANGKIVNYNGSAFERQIPQNHAILADETETNYSTTPQEFATSKYTIPAGTLRAGSTIRVRFAANITLNGTNNKLYVSLYDGSTLFSVVSTAVSGGTGAAFGEALFTVRSTGATGAVRGIALHEYPSASSVDRQTGTLDTAQAIDVSVYGFASTNSSATLEQFIVDVT
jgi:hypothetical protein